MSICPKSVLEMSERRKSTPLREDDCIGCRQCENICPEIAITVAERAGKEDKENA